MSTKKVVGGGDTVSATCPFHEDHTPSLSVTKSMGLYYCHACGFGGDVIDYVRRLSNRTFLESCEWLLGSNFTCPDPIRRTTMDAGVARALRRDIARSEWRSAVPLAGTPAELYLASRGIAGNVPGSIRFSHVPRWYDLDTGEEGPRLPAMLSACQEVDGQVTGIQRLFLDRQGRKRRIAKPRLCFGQIRGGALRLGPEARELMLCEGVEDGLSLMRMFPGAIVWVALGSGNLPHVALPPRVRRVVIAADGDAPGLAAAAQAQAAYAARGLEVEVILPGAGAKDFNEEWLLLHA